MTENVTINTNPETAGSEKPMKKNETINDYLRTLRILFENLGKDEIKGELAKLNLTENYLGKGKMLLEETFTLQAAQQKEYGESLAATQEFQSLWEVAEEEYLDNYRIAKVLFAKDDEKIKSLGLSGTRKQSFTGFLQQAEQFYQNLTKDSAALAKFAELNISETQLKTNYENFRNSAKAKAEYESEKAEAVEATRKRDAKLDELTEWVRGFKVLAKIALKKRADLLKKLGI